MPVTGTKTTSRLNVKSRRPMRDTAVIAASAGLAVAVAGAVYRFDSRERRIDDREFPADALDVAVDRAIADRGAVRIGAVHQLLSCQHCAWPPRQCLDEQELRHRERHGATFPLGRQLDGIDEEIAGGEGRLRRLTLGGPQRSAPQQDLHPGHQLTHRERLAQIVIRANLESEHTIELFLARGDEDDRQAFRTTAQATAQLQAIHPWKTDVENRQIRQRSVQRVPRSLPVGKGLGGAVLAPERGANPFANRLFVLDDRHLFCPRQHGITLPPVARRRTAFVPPRFAFSAPSAGRTALVYCNTKGAAAMRNSATARIVVMGGLAIVLMVPLMLVQNTVAERSSRRDAAVADVSATWGGPQVVGGPVLAVPYVAAPTDTSGRVQRATFHAFVLPRNVQFEGRLATERRNRGIFDVPVYRAVLKVTGTFIRPDLEWIRPVPERIAWDEASLQVGIADPRGIVRRSSVAWRGGTQPLNGGGVDTGLFRSGLHAALPQLDTAPVHAELPFELTLEFNGTRSLHLLP